MNSILSWFLKKRKHQIDSFTKYPLMVQQEVLSNLVQFSKKTKFGECYHFSSINGYKDFTDRVPIQQYESIEPLIERCRKGEQNLFWPTRIKWFAKSSGTTNAKSKFIPVSNEALKDCHFKAGKDLLCLYMNNNNNLLLNGKMLRLGGSSCIYKNNHSYFGDLSAIIIETLPFWANYNSSPCQKIALMGEWKTKIEAIINETIHKNITSLIGVPSWMLILLNKVLEKTGKKSLLEVWPNLEVYFHGGVSFAPYKKQYKKLIPKENFQYYESYNASEGFFAQQDRNYSSDLLLMLDYGIFYEFIPMKTYKGENSTTIPLSEVKKGENYAIVITTNSGLWRYLIGDTVRFTSLNPYRIRVTGRTKHHINVFGEELIIENAEEALKIACNETQSTITDYTVGPIFMDGKKKGSHEWVIEFEKKPKNLKYFTELLDKSLKSINSDYEAKRYNNMTLDMPKVHSVDRGLFHSWLKKKGKLGGQHKVARLSNERDFVEELLSI